MLSTSAAAWRPAIPKVKAAVKQFLAAVSPKDQVTILGFNDNIFALTRRAVQPAERERAVDSLAPWGATALYDVILRGLEMAANQTGRRVIVVFTDGEDQGSHARIEDVERRLLESDVTLYMIGQGRATTPEPLKKVMVRLSEPTGSASAPRSAVHIRWRRRIPHARRARGSRF